MTTIFETETCTRCGGTGHFSYNQITGTTCFKCNGGRMQFTKRGAAASAWLRKRLETPVSEIKVGDRVWLTLGVGSKRRVCTVQAVRPTTSVISVNGVPAQELGLLDLDTDQGGYGGLSPSYIIHRAPKQEDLDAALAYQATLTKAGKPAKRGAA